MKQWQVKFGGETLDLTKHVEYVNKPGIGCSLPHAPTKEVDRIIRTHYPRYVKELEDKNAARLTRAAFLDDTLKQLKRGL